MIFKHKLIFPTFETKIMPGTSPPPLLPHFWDKIWAHVFSHWILNHDCWHNLSKIRIAFWAKITDILNFKHELIFQVCETILKSPPPPLVSQRQNMSTFYFAQIPYPENEKLKKYLFCFFLQKTAYFYTEWNNQTYIN